MMNKNATIFLGVGVIGVALYMFSKQLTGNTSNKQTSTPPSSSQNTATAPNGQQVTKQSAVSNVTQALKDNSIKAVYYGKLFALNQLLKLGSQTFVSIYTTRNLQKVYKLWKNLDSLPYGDINEGNVDRYIIDVGLAYLGDKTLKGKI